MLRVLGGVLASLPGLQPQADTGVGRGSGWHPVAALSITSFHWCSPRPCRAALRWSVRSPCGAGCRRVVCRRGAAAGELTAQTEYTATAFSKPLMMIFRAVYRPTRQVESLADVSPYFPHEVRYRAEIEPTFERYVYGPLLRAVLRMANGMKVLQAGSLHAYLAYVIALVV